MNTIQKTTKIAIVYDWIDSWGGVERLLLILHEMFPDATFFTSYYDQEKAKWAQNINIRTSFIQYLPDFIKKSRLLSTLFYPFAFESFDFSDYDVVISVSSSFAKGIITRPGTKHISYLLTPTRFLWSHFQDYFSSFLVKALIKGIREWDVIAAKRPDLLITLSQAVSQRIKKYYHRHSLVIYPPFDIEYWAHIKTLLSQTHVKLPQKYFLIVSRLEKYKKIDLVIRTFNKLPKENLIIVGTGREQKNLRAMADRNIHFLGSLTDEELAYIYSSAEALIMPQEEDFGYVALEAIYFNCPVIAYEAGGALETVISDKTGVFFGEQSEEGIKSALEKYHTISYNIKRHFEQVKNSLIEKFSKDNFINEIYKTINN